MAIASAYLLNRILKLKCKSYFVVEMPFIKSQCLKTWQLMYWKKTKSFVTGAGKIILALSVILWFLALMVPVILIMQKKLLTNNMKNTNSRSTRRY